MKRNINEVIIELEQKYKDAVRKAERAENVEAAVLSGFYLGKAEAYRMALYLLEGVE